jgi:hypothetical protein
MRIPVSCLVLRQKNGNRNTEIQTVIGRLSISTGTTKLRFIRSGTRFGPSAKKFLISHFTYAPKCILLRDRIFVFLGRQLSKAFDVIDQSSSA